MNTTEQIIRPDQGVALGDLRHGQHIYFQPEYLSHGGAALELLKSLRGGGDRNRATLAITRCLTRFRLESAIQLTGIARQLCHIDRGAQLADEPSRVPGGTAGQFLAFEQYHIGNPDLGQVISNRNPNDSATDDDDLTLLR